MFKKTIAAVGIATLAGAGALATLPDAVAKTGESQALIQLAACNPCNPCAAKKACNPCNPCAAKIKKVCDPCNPCAAKKACSPCNPCAAKKK